MPSRFERYRVRDGVTVLGERYFNPVFQDVDLRLAALEDIRMSWEAAVQAVSDFGLLRINEVIGPAIEGAAAQVAEIDAARQGALTALSDLQAAIDAFEDTADTSIANYEAAASADIAAWKSAQLASLQAWKDSLSGSLPALEARLAAVESGTFLSLSYESRGDLRAGTPTADQMAVVEGLGLFIFRPGSDEPDDDESCFAASNGRWLLEAPHWDVVDAWQLPDDEARDAWDEDEPLRFDTRFASSFSSKVLTGTATCALTSVSAISSASFTGTVPGAAVGDRVIATPPAQLGATVSDTGRLSYHAWVSDANTVTVMLTNASAAGASTNVAIQTAWPITVIKT